MPQSKFIHIIESQKELLLDYMQKNPELDKKSCGREKCIVLWGNLADTLNCQELGAKKDVRSWRETWNSWKNKVRTKSMKITAFMQGAVGSKPPTSQLTDIEKRLLVFMGEGPLVEEKNIPDTEPLIIIKRLPSENEDEITFETIECTIDTYEAELNTESEHGSQFPLPSGQSNDSGVQLTNSDESGSKRKTADKLQDTKRSRPAASCHSAIFSLEERTLAAAEETARSVSALVALCERYADAAERTAGAAERRARAAERMADAAERQALVAENSARKALLAENVARKGLNTR